MTHDDDFSGADYEPDESHDHEKCGECLGQCYVDGRNSRRRGTRYEDCPHPRGSRSAIKWRMGWTDLEAELVPPPAGSRSLAAVEHDIMEELGRVRLAINAARAAGFPLQKLEELHDEWLEANMRSQST